MDTSLRVIWRNWRTLLLLSLVIGAPGLILNMVTASWMGDISKPESNLFGQAAQKAAMGDFSDFATIFGVTLASGLVGLFFYPLINGGVAVVTSRMMLGEEPVRFGEAFRTAAGRYGAVLGTSVLKGLFFILGAPLVMVVVVLAAGVLAVVSQFAASALVILAAIAVTPGLIAVAVFTAFTTPIVVLEGAAGGLSPMRRSWLLVRGQFRRIFWVGVVFSVLTMVISGMLTWSVGLPVGLLQAFGRGNAVLGLIYSLMQGLAMLSSLTISMVGLTVTYYDLRVRKEGLDLELAAKAYNPPAGQEP